MGAIASCAAPSRAASNAHQGNSLRGVDTVPICGTLARVRPGSSGLRLAGSVVMQTAFQGSKPDYRHLFGCGLQGTDGDELGLTMPPTAPPRQLLSPVMHGVRFGSSSGAQKVSRMPRLSCEPSVSMDGQGEQPTSMLLQSSRFGHPAVDVSQMAAVLAATGGQSSSAMQ
jgi:hypothetical protein